MSDGLIDPLALLRFLSTYFWRAVKFSIVALILAFAVYYVMPVKYSATALVFVDPRTPRITANEDVLPGIGNDAIALESLVQVAKSDGFLRPLIEKLKIADDPEFNSKSFLSGKAPTELALLSRFAKQLTIERRGITYVVEVTFTSKNREKAAVYANAVAETFVSQQTGTRIQAATEAADWLKERLSSLANAVHTSEAAVAAARAEYGIVDAGNSTTVREREMSDLVQQVALARSNAEQALARYQQARDNASNPLADTGADSSGSSVISNLRLQHAQIQRQIADQSLIYGDRHPKLLALKAQLSSTEKQITAELNRQISLAERAANAAREQQFALEKQLASLESKASDTDGALVKVRALEREADANRRLYEEFLSRFKQANEQSSLQNSEARVVSPATPPLKSTRFSPIIVAIGGLMLGIAGGYGSALLGEALTSAGLLKRRAAKTRNGGRTPPPAPERDRADRRETAGATAPKPAEPAAKPTVEAPDHKDRFAAAETQRAAEAPTGSRKERFLAHLSKLREKAGVADGHAGQQAPYSLSAAANRETRDWAHADPIGEIVRPWMDLIAGAGNDAIPRQFILVAGATAKAPHAAVARSLARSAANSGFETLLITNGEPEAAAQRPTLADVIDGNAELLEALQLQKNVPLSILPLGDFQSSKKAIARLGDVDFLDFMELLRGYAEVIVFDAPPTGNERALRPLVSQVDAVMMVKRSGAETPVAERALAALEPHEDCHCQIVLCTEEEAEESARLDPEPV